MLRVAWKWLWPARAAVNRWLAEWSNLTFRGVRWAAAKRYLRGDGIEIGALHEPLRLPRGARVRYVDRMNVADLRRQYPELQKLPLVHVDIVDDGERLTRVADASQDFLIANHFLEHCEDPIGTLKQFVRVVRPGGILYLAVPDKRFTFDAPRTITPLSHLWDDHHGGAAGSRRGHFEDVVRAGERLATEAELRAATDRLLALDYSIHFHVWTQHEIVELIVDLQRRLPIEIELVQKNGHEVLLVLRRLERGFVCDTAIRHAA
jgi:SAM-dependent methyltransferase